MQKQGRLVTPLLFFLYTFPSFHVLVKTGAFTESLGKENPFTPKAFLIRYWNKNINNNLSEPSFLLSKSSPLTGIDTATFTKLATQKALSSHLSTFCSLANLRCFSDTASSSENNYNIERFTKYFLTYWWSETYSMHRLIEPGEFFREMMLKRGTIMPMPNVKDLIAKRSFLPRSISSKLPFSTSKLDELREIFHVRENSSMERIMKSTLRECQAAPNPGEIKRCVGSVEDMIDFAISVLGENITVRTINSVKGSNENVMIGRVNGINNGRVTRSVSCHQILYPYLVYYCHLVPNVRVYESDILDPITRTKINHGVAICHVNTSSWSSNHPAFLSLGFGPGKIEVCHWIFENDMSWTTVD